MRKIFDDIRKAPNSPGIYVFQDKKGVPLYVGRSVNLRERLKSYLNPIDPRIKALRDESYDLKVVTYETILETFIEEASLIKKCQPKYNIKEKDDRSFIYISIPKENWSYPRLIRGRLIFKNDGEVFGPFRSLRIAKSILLILRKVFPYSSCKLDLGKPCFHRQIDLCPGKCTGEITKNEYNRIIKYLRLFLGGEKEKSVRFLKKYYPKRFQILEMIDDSLLIVNEDNLPYWPKKMRIEGYDISHFAGKETVGSMVVFKDGEPDKKEYRLFKIRGDFHGDDIGALREVFERRIKHSEWKMPDLILVDGGKAQVNVFDKILLENKIKIPVLGIAKNSGDKLVLGKYLKENNTSLETLILIRDEAHRFSNSLRKKIYRKKMFR